MDEVVVPESVPGSSILGYVVARLQASKGRWREIAEKSQVPKRTLEKIAMGETTDPGVTTVEKLWHCLRAEELAGGGNADQTARHRIS